MSDSSDPMNCSPPGSSVCGISQQKYWSGLPFPPPPTNILILDLLALRVTGTAGMLHQMRVKENFISCFLFLSVDLGYENCIGKDYKHRKI